MAIKWGKDGPGSSIRNHYNLLEDLEDDKRRVVDIIFIDQKLLQKIIEVLFHMPKVTSSVQS